MKTCYKCFTDELCYAQSCSRCGQDFAYHDIGLREKCLRNRCSELGPVETVSITQGVKISYPANFFRVGLLGHLDRQCDNFGTVVCKPVRNLASDTCQKDVNSHH